eukprot:4086120-Prorocentrum_lima.AAC.1
MGSVKNIAGFLPDGMSESWNISRDHTGATMHIRIFFASIRKIAATENVSSHILASAKRAIVD